MLIAPQFERGFSSPSQIEIIESLSQLSAMSSEWWALWHAAPHATPFSSPAWLLCWARHYAPERVRAITIREDGVLVALLPFFNWRGALLLAGTGPTDYGEALILPGREEFAQALLRTLATQAEAFHCARIDLQQLAPDSPLLHASAPQNWRSEIVEGDVCPVACAQGKDGMECASRALRAELRRSLHKLQREGGVELGGARRCELRSAARTLEWLHGRRWRQRGEGGKLADPLMCAFLRSLVPELDRTGLLRFCRLKCAQRPLAAALVMQRGDAAHFYLTGFDPAWSRYSPGLLTIAEAMRAAFAEGAREFHFLRGSEPYKYRLGARNRPRFRRMLMRTDSARTQGSR